jgi:tripartite ATP-independent transporter DctP family solute receptor
VLAWTRAVALALAFALAATTAAEARAFRAADNQGEQYPTVQALFYFDRLIRERTNGRHSVQVFHSRQLGEEERTVEQTRAGAIDLVRVNVAHFTRYVPELDVLVLPFLFRSTEHSHRVLDGPIGQELLARFEPRGFIGLAFYDSGARSFYTNRPVRRLEDMKGLRIRVQQSDLAVAMIRALGAEAVVLPYGQVGTALQTGLVDGAENNWPSYVTTGHYRSARYYTLTEHTLGPELLMMSARAWETLSPDDQAIFREAARESGLFMRKLWSEWEERARREAADGGNQIIADIDRAPFVKAVAPLYEQVLRDPYARELVARIQATP